MGTHTSDAGQRDARGGRERDRRQGVRIFRDADGPGLVESGTMSPPEYDADDLAVLRGDGPRSPLIGEGAHDVVLFRGDGSDGFSLVRAWFGPHFVLPRHSHSGDCLYYVAEGSLTMGSQTLSAGDGFFVPDGAPYGYEAGPDGVVVLEFRDRTSFDMRIPGGQVERHRRLSAAADEHGERWAELRRARRASAT